MVAHRGCRPQAASAASRSLDWLDTSPAKGSIPRRASSARPLEVRSARPQGGETFDDQVKEVPVSSPLWLWIGLPGALSALLAIDVLVFNRRPGEVPVRRALVWSVVWLALGLGFAGVVWALGGSVAAREYLAGYLIERTLSLDNLFVFTLIFGYFAVPVASRHRALVWGVLGALVFRAAFIAVGGVALDRLSWLTYLLGAFLVYTGIRIARHAIEVDPERNRLV